MDQAWMKVSVSVSFEEGIRYFQSSRADMTSPVKTSKINYFSKVLY